MITDIFCRLLEGVFYETMTQLEMAKRLGYIDDLTPYEIVAKEIAKMLTALMKKYLNIQSSTSTSYFN